MLTILLYEVLVIMTAGIVARATNRCWNVLVYIFSTTKSVTIFRLFLCLKTRNKVANYLV
jgi:hypothetical protein